MFSVRLLLLVISLIVSLAVLVNCISGILAYTDSEAALTIAPLNSQSRVSFLISSLADQDATMTSALETMAMRGAAWEPADARYVSILGLLRDAEGNRQEAQTYYQAALAILPVEIQALSRQFLWQLEKGQYRQAVQTADIIYRRWPQYLDIVSAQLTNILSNADGYSETLTVFGNLPNGPRWLVDQLSEDPDDALLVHRVLLDLNAKGHAGLRPAINRLTSQYIKSGNSVSAYQLFLNTLNNSEQSENGYIYNGDFNLDPNGNPFDWNLTNQSGMDFSIVDFQTGEGSNRALRVRFLDSPVRFNRQIIFTRLPPSIFSFSIDYSTRSLRGPKPIRLIIDCLQIGNRPTELTSIELAIGGSSDQVDSVDFTVPPSGCALQRLRLVNDNFVESWQNRYSGSLLLKSVSVSRSQ